MVSAAAAAANANCGIHGPSLQPHGLMGVLPARDDMRAMWLHLLSCSTAACGVPGCAACRPLLAYSLGCRVSCGVSFGVEFPAGMMTCLGACLSSSALCASCTSITNTTCTCVAQMHMHAPSHCFHEGWRAACGPDPQKDWPIAHFQAAPSPCNHHLPTHTACMGMHAADARQPHSQVRRSDGRQQAHCCGCSGPGARHSGREDAAAAWGVNDWPAQLAKQ